MFPVVTALSGNNSGGNVTTSTVDIAALVGTPDVGDLILVGVAWDSGAPNDVWPAGYTDVISVSFNGALRIKYRLWQAGDSTSIAITHDSDSAAWEVVRVQNGTFDHSTAPVGSTTSGNSTNPDPVSFNPSTWDVEDTLWVAFAANDGNVAITAGPSGYSGFRNDRVAASTGVGIAVAWVQNAAASEDAGAFTMVTEQWGAATVAVRPVRVPPKITTVLQAVNRAGSY